jgi:hypothetical protein
LVNQSEKHKIMIKQHMFVPGLDGVKLRPNIFSQMRHIETISGMGEGDKE